MCNNKIIRQGRLLLVSQKDFYITFTILIKGQTKKYDVPYPFNIEKTSGQILFDYRIETLCSKNPKNTEFVLNLAAAYSPNKFFNNVIEINTS